MRLNIGELKLIKKIVFKTKSNDNHFSFKNNFSISPFVRL